MTTSAEETRLVTSSQIPVRNLWLLELFASHLYRRGGADLAGFETMPEELPDAVTRLLVYETETRLRQSLSVGFRRRQDQLPRVRGRIDVLDTYRHRYLDRGRVSCRFDEIVVDTPGNRLVRAALSRATRLVNDPELAQRTRALQERFRAFGVGDSPPRAAEISALLADRSMVRDRRMLCAAELLLTFRIPAPGGDGRAFVDIADGDHFLRRLFEHAVHGFFEHRLSPAGWSVRHGHQLDWDIESSSPGLRALLPSMFTDVELEQTSARRHIVIDTKFTSITRPNQYDRDRFKSEYIYQMYSYLMSQHDRRSAAGLPPSEGLLLHPVVRGHVDEELTVQGHRIRFYTVDLAARADIVIAQLVGAVSDGPADPVPDCSRWRRRHR
ncbi:MAG: 5-methylcytosine-specific restriction system specificity protein McrC [Rhodococcus sp. (in: high G+C Gram-positive bacteria)]|uniref:5-methylcytosine restriction system specificity protein McrC n=1 Tax=Rhodococcus sp. TaxID=1831 RepID=UPI003BB76320